MLYRRLVPEYADAHATPPERRNDQQRRTVSRSFWVFCYGRFRDHLKAEADKLRKRAETHSPYEDSQFPQPVNEVIAKSLHASLHQVESSKRAVVGIARKLREKEGS